MLMGGQQRDAGEVLWDRRLCHKLCPWFRSRVQASGKSVCFCQPPLLYQGDQTTSFPGSTPLSRWRLRAEKTLAHTVRPPAKYSTNRGVFFHVTHNRISSSLHLISGCRNQKWLKMSEDLASMWLHFACFSCKIGFFGGPLNFQIHLS